MSDHADDTWGRRTFLKATGTAGAAAALAGVSGASEEGSTGGTRELIIGLSLAEDVDAIVDRLPPNVQERARDVDLGFILAEIRDFDFLSAAETESRIVDVPGVKYVEPNVTYETFESPDDPRYGDQYAPQQVNAPQAWDTTQGSEDVTVAIVDQGVMYDHPDLADQFGSTKGEDFAGYDSDPYPDNMSEEYHGTHVAGIASASTNNGEGIAGVSDSRLLSARALGSGGSGSLSDIAQAVRWATDQGADVINMSLGGGGYTETMKDAVNYALNNGSLPICAAGNDYGDAVSYPAAYEECVAVSAVNENEELADFSNKGPKIDLAAPGVDILSCWTEDSTEYNRISGTSMACPVVSGVAALVKADNPGLSPGELRATLTDTAVDIGLPSEEQGSGRVDAANALSGGGGGDGNESPDARFRVEDAVVEPGDVVEVDAHESSDSDGSIVAYDWDFDDGETATGRTAEHTYDEPGEYGVQLAVRDDDGARGTATKTVTVENDTPKASFSVEDATVKKGVEVSVDASSSSDPDGTVEEYHWEFRAGEYGESATATGQTASHTYESTGEYTIELTVTDNYGAEDSVTSTVTVEQGCGRVHKESERSGSLSSGNGDNYTYSMQTEDPCQVAVMLDGPKGEDLDLYLTLDGRTPSADDYDRRSRGPGSEEQIIVNGRNLDPGTQLGIRVRAYQGGGDYTLTIHEWGTLHNDKPTAKINPSSTSVDEGEVVTFDASDSVDPNGNATISTYEWSIPGSGWLGASKTKTGKVVEEEFSGGGTYTVTLTVKDKWGATDTDTVEIDVSENWWGLW